MITALYFTSERKMPRNQWGQWNSCRVIAAMSATGIASANECFLRNGGRHMGLTGRVNLAIRGLKAPDGNWKADTGFNQGDVDEMHDAMFPGLPLPVLVGTTDWWSLFTHLPNRKDDGSYTDGNVINIAQRLSALPASDPARKYTSADHQVTLRARKKTSSGWMVKRIDPMRPQSDNYQGDWIPADSVRDAAKAINGGVILAELYGGDGDWTEAKLARQAKDEVIAALSASYERELKRVRERRDEFREARDAAIEALRICEAGGADDHDLADCIDRTIEWMKETTP